MKDLLPTDEIVDLNPYSRVPVVTRVLRLAGVEQSNRNTPSRLIYIHGSPVEMYLGQPASQWRLYLVTVAGRNRVI